MKTKFFQAKTLIPVAILIALLISSILSFYQSRVPKKPPIIRQVSLNSHFSQLWEKQFDLGYCTVNADPRSLYACTGDNYIVAMDIATGSIIWRNDMLYLNGARSLIKSSDTIFATSTFNIYAFNSKDGTCLWSTKLGNGGVGMMLQLDGNILRVYYGDNIIEIDPANGQILKTSPVGSILWITRGIEIHQLSQQQNYGMVAYKQGTTQSLWNTPEQVFVAEEGTIPEILDANSLVVFVIDKGICSLNLDTGRYTWCMYERPVSDIAIDQKSSIGFFLREDYSLVALDLDTGKELESIQFTPSTLPSSLLNSSFPYSVALSENILIVSFGDSDQTFALNIRQPLKTP